MKQTKKVQRNCVFSAELVKWEEQNGTWITQGVSDEVENFFTFT